MAASNVIRLSILGTSPGGEKFSVNPVWQIGGVDTFEEVTSADIAAIASACAAVSVPAGILAMLNGNSQYVGVRAEARTWDGALQQQAEQAKATPQVGAGSQSNPFQTSFVSSLRTAGVGASARGRLFWPATGMGIQVLTMRPTTALVTASVGAIKTYLTSLTAAIAPSLTNAPVLSVWSRTSGVTRPVTSIQGGDVLDVQRRRRDSLIETYQSVTYP